MGNRRKISSGNSKPITQLVYRHNKTFKITKILTMWNDQSWGTNLCYRQPPTYAVVTFQEDSVQVELCAARN